MIWKPVKLINSEPTQKFIFYMLHKQYLADELFTSWAQLEIWIFIDISMI